MSLISATTWVPRGFASEDPVRYDFDDEEMDRLAGMATLKLSEAKEEWEDAEDDSENEDDEDSEEAGPAGEENNKAILSALKRDEEDGDLALDEDLKEYDLEHYDDEPEDAAAGGEGMAMFSNIKNLVYHDDENGDHDPYITLPPSKEEDEEEKQEWKIYPTDNLILATKTEEEVSTLEVYVYDDNAEASDNEAEEDEDKGHQSNLYVHHDMMLPSFPLCVEWLDYRVGKGRELVSDPETPGNFAAIGTFEPEIEIWNVDAVDSPVPDLILGAKPEDDQGADAVMTEEEKSMKKKKKKKAIKKKINDRYHIDAVLSLSANRIHRNLLVSGSADTTVKLWDLNTGVCAKSLQLHDDKVSAVRWNPVQGTVLLSGGYDRNAVVCDLRVDQSNDKGARRKWSVESDIECLKWGANGYDFYVGTETGIVHKFDARNEGKAVWKLQAHDSGISSFDVSSIADGYMVTGANDKLIKLWDLNGETGPSMILSRDMDVGKVFSVGFAPDKEVFGHVVVAGASGKVKVWDTMSNRTVYDKIGKAFNVKQRKKEKVVEMENDENEESEDDGDEDVSSGDDV